jgi:hypothetical protein
MFCSSNISRLAALVGQTKRVVAAATMRQYSELAREAGGRFPVLPGFQYGEHPEKVRKYK